MKKHLLVTFALFLCIVPGGNDFALAQSKATFTNPILAGFYPDPSICRVGPDFYLVTSSFAYFPGLPVFHSTDLVHWEQVGSVLDRAEQLNLDSAGVSRGLFAPAIRYHNGVFYVTCTLVDKGGNFVVTATSPRGPWSKPVWIPQADGIDPSLFFDDDSSAYFVYNSIPPDNKPLYDGHRTIRMRSFDARTLRVTGEEHLLINGGTDISKKPVWIEAPHIFKKDGYYYLIAAEGGTAENHSEVVFRSRSVTGPYVSFEKNPILTQRTLDPAREFPVTCTGHADFVQTTEGDWWAVFLGCRPYRPFDKGYYNTGRETFLAPVRWQDGWPVINPDNKLVPFQSQLPRISSPNSITAVRGGRFVVKDDFNGPKLLPEWIFLRTPREEWYDLSDREGYLALRVRPETCSGPMNPAFIAYRQQHSRGSANTALEFSPKAANEKAGLAVFQNENHFYFIARGLSGDTAVVQLYKSSAAGSGMELIGSHSLQGEETAGPLYLKIESRGSTYAFFYAVKQYQWNSLAEDVDAAFLSTKVAGGFVGCVYALYATSLGKPADNTAYFDWFQSMNDDEVY